MNNGKKESMKIKTWEEIIFLHALEAAKEIKPNTPEWQLIWSTFFTYKNYAEKKYENENEKEKRD